jgi:hypothetical protein
MANFKEVLKKVVIGGSALGLCGFASFGVYSLYEKNNANNSQPAIVEPSRTPTGTPTLTSKILSTEFVATNFPTLLPSPTSDPKDLSCDTQGLEHFHVPGVVAPVGRKFGDALVHEFVDFYNSSWGNLSPKTLEAFAQKGLENRAQLLPISDFKPETFKNYAKKVDLFFMDVQPMNRVNQELDLLTAKLSKEFPSQNPADIRAQLKASLYIDQIVPETADGEKPAMAVFARMNGVKTDPKTKEQTVVSYSTEYLNRHGDQYFSISRKSDGRDVNGFDAITNRQGFIVKVTVENGKVVVANGFDGLRIDYDDFTGKGCLTGSNNVAGPTSTPGSTATPTVPGPSETPGKVKTPENTPERTPRHDNTPTPVSTETPRPTGTVQGPVASSTPFSLATDTIEPTITHAPTAVASPTPRDTSTPVPNATATRVSTPEPQPTSTPRVVPSPTSGSSSSDLDNQDSAFNRFLNGVVDALGHK